MYIWSFLDILEVSLKRMLLVLWVGQLFKFIYWSLADLVEDREAWHGVAKSRTRLSDWNRTRSWFTMSLLYNKVIHLYIYPFIFVFFPIVVYPWILNIIPCTVQEGLLFFHSIYSSLHLLIPSSQSIPPHPNPLINHCSLWQWDIFLTVIKFTMVTTDKCILTLNRYHMFTLCNHSYHLSTELLILLNWNWIP